MTDWSHSLLRASSPVGGGGQIRAFKYNDDVEEAEDDEEMDECDRLINGAVEKEQAIIATKRPLCNVDITNILELITQQGELMSFEWDNRYESCEDIEPRAKAFWITLAGTAVNSRATFAFICNLLATQSWRLSSLNCHDGFLLKSFEDIVRYSL